MKVKKIFKWSSHTPVLNAAIKVIQPKLIVELGIGNFSTPLLINSPAEKTFHIENDLEWFNKITQELSYSEKNNFIYHEIDPLINKSVGLNNLNDPVKNKIISYYSDLKEQLRSYNNSPKLLFVDQFTCARVLSINILSEVFDIIIYHDAEHPDIYNYEKIDKDLLQNFNHYRLINPGAWTGFLIKKNLKNEEFISSIINEAEIFGKTFDVPSSEFKVEKVS